MCWRFSYSYPFCFSCYLVYDAKCNPRKKKQKFKILIFRASLSSYWGRLLLIIPSCLFMNQRLSCVVVPFHMEIKTVYSRLGTLLERKSMWIQATRGWAGHICMSANFECRSLYNLSKTNKQKTSYHLLLLLNVSLYFVLADYRLSVFVLYSALPHTVFGNCGAIIFLIFLDPKHFWVRNSS